MKGERIMSRNCLNKSIVRSAAHEIVSSFGYSYYRYYYRKS